MDEREDKRAAEYGVATRTATTAYRVAKLAAADALFAEIAGLKSERIV